MDTLLKADIFFFISSIATVVLSILLAVALWYVIKAGRNLFLISEKLKNDFKDSEEFVSELKDRLENNIAFRIFFPPLRRGQRRAADKADQDDEK